MSLRCILLSLIAVLLVLATATADQTPDRQAFAQALVQAALDRTQHQVRYDASYRRIAYPMGDVPDDTGVCTDVVIRSYRAVGIDLQRLVHEDMRAHFSAYPSIWGLSRPDRNIDHRRVPNLQRFFERHGTVLPRSRRAADYRPGDLVTWMLPGHLPHIGIVMHMTVAGTERPLIVHNIGAGPQLDDMLWHYEITGHYRFGPVYTDRGEPQRR